MRLLGRAFDQLKFVRDSLLMNLYVLLELRRSEQRNHLRRFAESFGAAFHADHFERCSMLVVLFGEHAAF